MSCLAEIRRPEHILVRGSRTIVRPDRGRRACLEVSGIPETDGRADAYRRRRRDCEVSGSACDPAEEGFPDGFGLRLVEPLTRHLDIERVPGPDLYDLAPMRVVQALAVEADEPTDQLAEGRARRRANRYGDEAEERRQIMSAKGYSRDHAEGAATTPLERPEKVRIRARVGDPHGPVGGDDLRFQETRGGGSVVLGIAAEAAALEQSGDADGPASAALHVAPASGRHLVVDMHPDGARPHRDGGLWRVLAGTPPGREVVLQRDAVHRVRPDQQ